MIDVFKGMRMRTTTRSADLIIQTNERYGIKKEIDQDSGVTIYKCERLPDDYLDLLQFKAAVNALVWFPVVDNKPYSFHQRVLLINENTRLLRYLRWFVPVRYHPQLLDDYLADTYGPGYQGYFDLKAEMLELLAEGRCWWKPEQ